jgi:dynein heavy chain
VTDEKDRRLLNVILKSILCPDSMYASYKYTESDIYYYPGDGNFLDYIHFVEKLPSFDTPDIFGLHDNA